MDKIQIDQIREEIINSIDLMTELSDEQIYEVIDSKIDCLENARYTSVVEKLDIRKRLFSAIRGFDVLQELIEDDNITEIMVNGKKDIFIEESGMIKRCNIQFSTDHKLENVIQQIVGIVNRRVNESSPIVDARLLDGSRVNVVMPPIALDGAVLTIRKFPKQHITMQKLIEFKSITGEAAKFLKILVEAKYNIFISGGTGSGKTTFLNVLSNYIPRDERIITIEDSAELRLVNVDNIVRLETRLGNDNGTDVTIRMLIRTALRMRPTRIIVGEVRGEEALDMLQAMSTGHDGSLSTGHSNTPRDMLRRLEMMVLMGAEIPLQAIREQIASAIDIIVHLSRMRDGSRKVTDIIEVVGLKEGHIELNPLFIMDYYDLTMLRQSGGKLINCEKLKITGVDKIEGIYE